MTTYFAEGSPETVLSDADVRSAVHACYAQLEPRRKVLAVPPDFTRFNSRAGLLTCQTHEYYGDRLVDVMPALGTHFPMPDWQLDKMFPGVPKSLVPRTSLARRRRDDRQRAGRVRRRK